MPFLSLHTYNFRNLQNEQIDLSSREVYFTGENGQGKSNLLEALYYSSYGNSFRTRNDAEIIKIGENSLSLYAFYKSQNSSSHTTKIVLENGHKTIEKDGKFLKDRKELVNTMPCVLYSHDDLDFAIGEPERRRFFIDQSLSMYDVLYIDVLRRYKKILKSRNILLKEQKYELLETMDFQLAQNGIEIQEKRKKAVFQFNQIFGDLYQRVTGIDGVKIKYEPSWKDKTNENLTPNLADVINILATKREVDKIRQTTMSGPHRDKIIFTRNDQLFIPTASTGQRRLIALLLRTAQATFYTQITGNKPVLLMDDVMLELDPTKRKKLTHLLPDYEQLFCTFLPGEPYDQYKTEQTSVYKISEGRWLKYE